MRREWVVGLVALIGVGVLIGRFGIATGWTVFASIITVASVLAFLTRPVKDKKIFGGLHALFSLVALNIGSHKLSDHEDVKID